MTNELPEMITTFPTCPDCRNGQILGEDGEFYPHLRCNGEGWLEVRVCSACGSADEDCPCSQASRLPLEHQPLKSLREIQSERNESEAA